MDNNEILTLLTELDLLGVSHEKQINLLRKVLGEVV